MTLDPADLPPVPPASARQGDPGHDHATERQVAIRLLTLRTAGMTYTQIAQEMGYADASGARQALLRALDRHEAENAAELRAIENMRLDSDERVLRSIITDTNAAPRDRIAAINSRTRVSARRSRMNGLDAPVQVAISAGVQAELQDALSELGETVGLVLGADGVYRVPETPDGADDADD